MTRGFMCSCSSSTFKRSERFGRTEVSGGMGAPRSKEEFLYLKVNYGNVEGIKALHRDGAGLEWIDNEGKTPLMLACLRPDLINVAKVLIELGANIHAYRRGSQAGTALHHAAKHGLYRTVNLLLSRGAKPFVVNDDCHTPLDLARSKGHCNVVRAMEGRISLFCGWMREPYVPSIVETFAPQWTQRKIWAVVIPCNHRSLTMYRMIELAIYTDLQAAQPRTLIQLWKTKIEKPKYFQPDPYVIIVERDSSMFSKIGSYITATRYKLLSGNKDDHEQLWWFYNACRGIPSPTKSYATVSRPATLTIPEDIQLARAINESIQSALAEGIPVPVPDRPGLSSGPSMPNPAASTVRPSSSSSQLHNTQLETPTVVPSSYEAPPAVTVVPSAPPIDEFFFNRLVQYPTIDSTPVDLNMPHVVGTGKSADKKNGGGGIDSGSGSDSGSCVICLDAPVEGACIPCGHMVGCMSCLNEIKRKKWGCPVCRADINQVVRLYAV